MLGIFEALIFICVFGYLLNKARANDMVDILKSHIQDAIIRLPGLPYNVGGNHENERPTAVGLKRFATEGLRRRNAERDQETDSMKRSLYDIKDTQTQDLIVQTDNTNYLTRRNPLSSSAANRTNESELVNQDFIDILQAGKYEPPTDSLFNWKAWFPTLAQCLRIRKFDYPQVADAVLKDDRLKTAMELSVRKTNRENRENYRRTSEDGEYDEDEQYDKVMKEHKKRTKHLLMDMRSKISFSLLRLASFVLYKLLPSFMNGVVAHPAHIKMLKDAAKNSPNVPLIFLPLHRSHLDYILVSFILFSNDIRAPIVAAGDNLRIPFFGALLRGLGAFFIKRKIDPVAGKKDIVYRAVLHTYMQHALAAGHNIEFFIEGGRTRTGKPCMPKSGVLSVIIDAFMDGTISDALLVPVSVNYERLVDGNFVYEQLGQKKSPETFSQASAAIWKILNSNYGQMRIDFNEPFSLQEVVNAFNKTAETPDIPHKMMKRTCSSNSMKRLQHQPSTSSLYGTDVVNEDHRILVDSIARRVVYDCSSATAVMTTNAVSFLLLTRFRDGATINVLADALDDLRGALKSVRAISFSGSSRDVIIYAAELLGSTLISSEKRNGQLFFKPVPNIRSFIELSYYSNSLAAHFALDSVMICALHKLSLKHEQNSPNTEFKVSKNELFKSCIEYCDILRYEFLFSKPCQKLNDLLEGTFDRLRTQNLVSIHTTVETLYNRRLNIGYDSEDSEYESPISEDEKANITLPSEGHCNRLVLMSVIVPYSHTYLTVVHSLEKLLSNGMLESEFIKSCVQEITNKVEKFECKYAESISTDTIRNCMKVLEKLGAIEITNTTGVRCVSLQEKYDAYDSLQCIVQRFESIVTV